MRFNTLFCVFFYYLLITIIVNYVLIMYNTDMSKEIKVCTRCNLEKTTDDFGQRKLINGGYRLNSQCKACAVEIAQEWRVNNLDKYREYQREYRKAEYHRNKGK